MLFSKKKKMKYDTHISFEEKINSIESSEVKQQSYVVDLCEQMVEASKEYEEASKEYQLVTKYLNDVEIIEKFPKEELKELREAAGNVAKLTRDRNLLMNVESKITETQFEQMQGMEAEIPDAIKRLKKNEEYLDVVSKDMKYLEGEKTEWDIMKEDCAKEQKKLRTVSIVLLILFALALAIIAITSYYYIFDTQLTLVILAFFTVLIGTGITIKYQNCTSNIRKSELSKNKAITLENRVKIKYVNTKNAVDYACEKYHVKNSNDLNNIYEEYMKTVRDKERYKITNDRLEHYTKDLLFLLNKHNIYNTKDWMTHANAIVDKKEMVELKHELFVRRQKLRDTMEYNMGVISDLKKEVSERKKEFSGYSKQIDGILSQIDRLELEFK